VQTADRHAGGKLESNCFFLGNREGEGPHLIALI
jgi:hypothetical protein